MLIKINYKMNQPKDSLSVVKAFQEEIEHSLGMKTWKKIEEKIKKDYNITVQEAIDDFPKFHAVLYAIFGNAAEKLESRILR